MSATIPELLSPAAIQFLESLHRNFQSRRKECLSLRGDRLLARLYPTAAMREQAKAVRLGRWQTNPPPHALLDRRVEITGPAEPKMMINALNSGAKVFMADLEDSMSPTWQNVIDGHHCLQKALRRTLSYKSPEGKSYSLQSEVATLVVRPRGWHLEEPRFQVDGEAMSGSLFDFGLYLFHGGAYGLETGRGPFFYLPKLETREEAALWADVFTWSEKALDLPNGSVRATVLIETLPGALAMEEIVYELRNSLVGLNAGRWDYLFSVIKSLTSTPLELIFPDRKLLTMAVPFMRRYAEAIVDVCHRRGAHAIGGMSAFIPSRKDEAANARAMDQVRIDKSREADQGFDGTWVAHPDLVPVAKACFDKVLGASPDQKESGIRSERTDDPSHDPVPVDFFPRASEEPFLSQRPTLAGVKTNIDVALRYIAHWFNGQGAVAIHGLMEDAATAEISRAQLWQWRRFNVRLESGEFVSNEFIRREVESAMALLKTETVFLSIAGSQLEKAAALLLELVEQDAFVSFLTLPAMDRLDSTLTPSQDEPAKDKENSHVVHSYQSAQLV